MHRYFAKTTSSSTSRPTQSKTTTKTKKTKKKTSKQPRLQFHGFTKDVQQQKVQVDVLTLQQPIDEPHLDVAEVAEVAEVTEVTEVTDIKHPIGSR